MTVKVPHSGCMLPGGESKGRRMQGVCLVSLRLCKAKGKARARAGARAGASAATPHQSEEDRRQGRADSQARAGNGNCRQRSPSVHPSDAAASLSTSAPHLRPSSRYSFAFTSSAPAVSGALSCLPPSPHRGATPYSLLKPWRRILPSYSCWQITSNSPY